MEGFAPVKVRSSARVTLNVSMGISEARELAALMRRVSEATEQFNYASYGAQDTFMEMVRSLNQTAGTIE